MKGVLLCWATVYVVYASTSQLHLESTFDSKLFREIATKQGIISQLSVVKSHNSIGVGECYHEPLRCVFNQIFKYFKSMSADVSLRLLNIAMNSQSYQIAMSNQCNNSKH